MSTNTLTPVAARTLSALAGPDAQLRDGQGEALDALLEPGARVLVVQATGWGKSAVYWIATATLRSQGAGPTLVVSPLLSLMRDQVAAAERAGLRAATLNSANFEEWSAVESALLADELDVLLVSPERLANPAFGSRVMDALAGRLGLLVIDEAHSISDWGHDFRPDYRRLARLLPTLSPSAPVLATTATANSRVVDDVAAQLGSETTVLRGPLARRSLQLAVLPRMDPLSRYAWVVANLPSLPGSGIIYTLTVADAERLADAIQAEYGDGFPVAAYTGGVDAQARLRLEESLRDNTVKALVATSALGMGYDKPDLGFVVHVGAPPSPVAYYQQVGRAGRAIDSAIALLLPAPSDDAVWDYFATATIPTSSEVSRLLALLSDQPQSIPALEAESGIRRSRVELLLKQLAVEDVVSRTADGWISTGATWEFDQAHYDGVLAQRRAEADIMRAYVRGERCLMQLLQQSLDDPTATPCGRCSVCLGSLPDGLSADVSSAAVASVRSRLRTGSQVLEPRKMWPGGAFGTKGRIPPQLQAEPGRVLVHADAVEWSGELAGALSSDGPASADLLDAAVSCLVSWKDSWSSRPTMIVSLAAANRRELVASVAERLAAAGRLPTAAWDVSLAGHPGAAASGEEAAWWRTVLIDPPEVAGQQVLLVVDETSSGWVCTVATAALRDSGASGVLPLVVHRTVG
ncbi:DEAD/DEAH box helicase [Branchiibius sp. NY16-3462-2]|uniref:RecQ family ATP-dependent DNA helicase n=1 Tax=Branchiibius sp. NY16-3462-2 TaxID=1807500 RepID=UPI00079476AB|nr:DEAD/DEAH box helicase [Branchiibius sp. NY16-3462-2]KYH44434.1 DEAD/DEAH box helicase [Branchiibius sp. NY16-3462-2]